MRERGFFHRFREGLPMRTKLVMAASLGVVVGIEIGYLISQGGVSIFADLWGDFVERVTSPHNGFGPTFGMLYLDRILNLYLPIFAQQRPTVGSIGMVGAVLAVKVGHALLSAPLGQLGSRTKDRLLLATLWGIPTAAFLLEGSGAMVVAWLGMFIVFLIGRIPFALLFAMFGFVYIVPELSAPNESQVTLYTLFIVAVVVIIFPSNLSLKRFLSPRRGVV